MSVEVGETDGEGEWLAGVELLAPAFMLTFTFCSTAEPHAENKTANRTMIMRIEFLVKVILCIAR